MNAKTLTLAALAALAAVPLAAAQTGPSVSVTADAPVNCQTARLDAEDLLGPQVRTRTDVWTDDCVAHAEYQGSLYVARCAPHGTDEVPGYTGPEVAVDSSCGVSVVA